MLLLTLYEHVWKTPGLEFRATTIGSVSAHPDILPACCLNYVSWHWESKDLLLSLYEETAITWFCFMAVIKKKLWFIRFAIAGILFFDQAVKFLLYFHCRIVPYHRDSHPAARSKKFWTSITRQIFPLICRYFDLPNLGIQLVHRFKHCSFYTSIFLEFYNGL